MNTLHIGRRISAITSHLKLKHSIISKLMRHTTDPSGCRSKAPAPAGPGLLFEAPSYSTWYTSSCKEEIDVCENPHSQPETSQYCNVQCFSFQNGTIQFTLEENYQRIRSGTPFPPYSHISDFRKCK